MHFEWLIIGGGIHGVHAAARLIDSGYVSANELGILDPEPSLLGRWRARAATTGMTYLRSPAVHHLDIDPWSLLHFAGKGKKRDRKLFAPPYDQPALELFNKHCDRVIERYELASAHIRGHANELHVRQDHVEVITADGAFLAQNIILALGAGEAVDVPEWAEELGERAHHVYDANFQEWPERERVAVIGGGITACQIALRASKRGQEVHLIARREPSEHQFDSAPGWLGPKYMNGYDRIECPSKRRAVITRARYRGSAPASTLRQLDRAVKNGEVHWHLGEVSETAMGEGGVALNLSTGEALHVDDVLLATGFKPARPGGAMIDALIEEAGLEVSACGYPLTDRWVRWHPRVRVMGPLAELELGPSARNISGARRAAERIVTSLVHDEVRLRRA